jgi:hypothetical protein
MVLEENERDDTGYFFTALLTPMQNLSIVFVDNQESLCVLAFPDLDLASGPSAWDDRGHHDL